MNFDKLDNLVHDILKNKFGENCERRDYRELEKNKQELFKGYGENMGIMFLVDVGYYHYLDVNLYEKKEEAKIVFKMKDVSILEKTVPIIAVEKYLQDVLSLIDDYLHLIKRIDNFNKSKVSKNELIKIKRDYRINDIINEE